MSPTEERITVWRNGYNPLPLNGKIPAIKDWPKKFAAVDEDFIRSWATTWPGMTNTGIITKRTPCLDLDLLNTEAGDVCESLVRERFDGRGNLLARFGRAPKRAIPFRTDKYFTKLDVKFAAADGGEGDKIEFLADGQQFAAFGTHPDTKRPYRWHGGSPLNIRHDELPYVSEQEARKLIDELKEICIEHGYKPIGKSGKAGSYGGEYVSFDELVEAIHSGASLHDPAIKIAGKMSRGRVDRHTCKEILHGIFISADQPRYAPRWPEIVEAIDYCYDKDEAKRKEHPEAIFLNDFLFHSKENKFIYQPSGELWAATAVDGRLPWINRVKPTTIIKQTAAVEQWVWMPGEPKLVKHKLVIKAGVRRRDNVTLFNLYDPPDLELGDPELAEPWRQHVRFTYPEEAEHIERWLAHRVQFPHKKLQHALLLGGTQGIGKDTMLYPVVYAVGPWNVESVTPMQAMGRFNGFLQSVILLVSEARDLGDVNRPQFYEHFKNFICSTAAPVHRIDEKNHKEFYIPNRNAVIITTNHKAGGIFLPAEDRRHFVCWSPRELADFDADYFKKIWGFYTAGGVHHVAAYLHTLDLSDFDAEAPPPKTAAFWEMATASTNPEVGELAGALEQLSHPVCVLDDLVGVSSPTDADFAIHLRDRKNRRMIPRWMEQCGWVTVRKLGTTQGLWKINGKQQVVYGKSHRTYKEFCQEIFKKWGVI
jgi:hypothetical protein